MGIKEVDSMEVVTCDHVARIVITHVVAGGIILHQDAGNRIADIAITFDTDTDPVVFDTVTIGPEF